MDFKTSRASKIDGNRSKTPYHTSAASQYRDKSCCEDFDWPIYGLLDASGTNMADDTWMGQFTSLNDRDWGTPLGTDTHPAAGNFLSMAQFFTPRKLVGTSFKIGTRRQNDGSNDTDTTMNLGISYYTIPFDSETASGTQTGVYASSNITVPNNSAHYLTNLDGEFSGIVIPANSWVLMAVKAAAIDGATTADIYFNGSLTFKKS